MTDPIEAAKAAQLRYVSDQIPGITRKRAGRGFRYFDSKGEPLTDQDQIERIKELVIPPAWTDVWICPYPNGHILATGRDNKGRKQYIYHPRWHEIRDETKFNRMIAFGEALPLIRARTDEDLRRHGLPREKVLAAVVRLLEQTLIRIGNEEYARNNETFGLTTLRDQHATVSGSKVQFEFRGKSGKEHTVDLQDRRLAYVVQRCQELPGQELFQYLDENGEPQTIDSEDVNDYLREITGQVFTAKDFRTWGGSVLAMRTLLDAGPGESKTETKRLINHTVKQVAQYFGNTTTVSRKYYIHPSILSCYQDAALYEALRQISPDGEVDSPHGLTPEERVFITFLRHCNPNTAFGPNRVCRL